MKAAHLFEKVGEALCPALGGVHVIEASKQIYANKGKGVASKVRSAIKQQIPVAKKPATNRRKSIDT